MIAAVETFIWRRPRTVFAASALLAAAGLSGCVNQNVLATQNANSILSANQSLTSSAEAGGLKPGDDSAELASALAPVENQSAASTAAALPKTATKTNRPVPPVAVPEAEAKAATTQLAAVAPAAKKPAQGWSSLFAPSTEDLESKRKLAAHRARLKRQREAKAKTVATAKPVRTAALTTKTSSRAGSSALPGVRSREGLFGIIPKEAPAKPKAKKRDRPTQFASAGSRALRGGSGFAHQTSSVRSKCFPRALVAILKKVERKYGRRLVITSGYRSKRHNRRIRGARNSTHTRCMAADIQVKGVSKWKLAKYLRSIPGRGGVGTYCWTKSVHIDVGKKRAWHYCNRRRKRRA